MSGKAKILTVIAMLGAGACWGQIDDPLHGCIIGTTCYDNGTVTPTTTNPMPTFTFTISPGPQIGDFLVDILIPDNEDPTPGSLSFSISGTEGGVLNTSSIGPFSSTLMGDWTSGGLGDFLGLTLANGSPKNNITAWLPYVQGNNCGASGTGVCDPGATGFEVYQINLGTNKLQGPSDPSKPILTLSGSSLPLASLLAGFLGNPTSGTWISTANSGAIFEGGSSGTTDGTVPEPTSILLFGTVALMVGGRLKRQFSNRA